jgi:hypothetical protein
MKEEGTMHYARDSIPDQMDFGGMAMACQRFPKGLDASPLLEGLPGNLCPCPHWGYAIAGKLVVTYEDGSTEEITAGDIYYMPPGHTGLIEEDFEAVEISPAEPFRQVMEHVMKKAQLSGA